MSYGMARATRAYASIGAQTSVESASPHRLIQLLLAGALDRIARAKGHMQRQEVAEKGLCIGRAMDIIEGLRVSLDRDVRHELTENLDRLYDYMNQRLLQANLSNDSNMLDEVARLLGELKQAWDAIPPTLHFGTTQGSLAAVGA